ncbi:MAG: SDR family NAD(P)-dependent oxidoreductase [Bacteroidetes bacterium]|nr:SDR family NAD(P)-dependent oxidoreductase [Bacteroidota bacterium]
MNYYYITGTSRGIGKGFAEHLLKDPSNKVIGISRQVTIEHPNYTHFSVDLTDLNAIADFKFELHSNAKKIYLINNAGALGFIKPIGKLDSLSIIKNYTLNLIAPSVLTNSFISTYNTVDTEKVILNISSGAGKSPIDGWAVYCASKAGLDMFSRVVDLEQKIRVEHAEENIHKGFKIFSIAPGVVNTTMQKEIRNASVEDFSRLQDFVNYKNNNQLADADFVSQKFLKVLSNIDSIKEVLTSIKDYE